MQATRYTDMSINLSQFLLKATGTWLTVTSTDKYQSRFLMAYTIAAHMYGIYMNVVDTYYTLDDLNHCIFAVCNVLNTVLALFKFFVLNYHKTELWHMISYAQQNFWHLSYNDDEKMLFMMCRKICNCIVFIICTCTQGSLTFYIIRPICANIGKNKSERVLPFNMWVDLPLSETPYYEITFFLQFLAVEQIGVAYVCPESLLCVLNLHVVYQFRILQYRLQKLWLTVEKETNASDYADRCYAELKKCVQQHQSLIEFCDKIEYVYTLPILSHVVVFSILMCFDTYEIILADVSAWTRIIFIFHMGGSFIHIIFFTYSCHGLIEESSNISTATYSGLWTTLPMSETGKTVRKDVKTMMMKSMRPCCLTAGGFFPVSLETSTALISSTMSYFALMRESSNTAESSE